MSIIILSVLLAIALGLGAILVRQTRMIKEMEDSVEAFYGADTGIERLLYEDKLCRQSGCGSLSWICVDRLNCNAGRSSTESPLSGTVGQASYNVTFNDGATSIMSRGLYGSSWRAIQVER